LISNNFIHSSQIGGLKQCSSSDTGVMLIHFICTKWIKNNTTSTLVFDITQFFLSLNHHLLLFIFNKARFDPKVLIFFHNYLVGRKTQYFWNKFFSPSFNTDVGVSQGSALSPILSILYIAPILHILENHLKIFKISVLILSFVDDGLLVVQSRSLIISNSLLFCSYQITSSLTNRFSLMIEHRKMEVFHFSRSQEVFNPPPLNLLSIGGLIL